MIKTFFGIFVLLLSSVVLRAQYRVTLVVHDKTYRNHDSIFVTGSFNNWDSTPNPAYRLKPYGKNEKAIILNFSSGTFQYKFHRGSWLKVEKKFDGDEVANREITVRRDTTLYNEIDGWRDEFFQNHWRALAIEKADTTRIQLIAALANAYAFFPEYRNTDSALYYAQKSLQLLQQLKTTDVLKNKPADEYAGTIINMQEVTASIIHEIGNFPQALEIRLKNLQLAEKVKNKYILIRTIQKVSSDFYSMKDYHSVLNYGKQMDSILVSCNRDDETYAPALFFAKYQIANAYYNLGMNKNALDYVKQALNIDTRVIVDILLVRGTELLGDIYAALSERDSALHAYRFVIKSHVPFASDILRPLAQAGIAKIYQKQGLADSALIYAKKSFQFFQKNKTIGVLGMESSLYYQAEISPLLADLYQQNNQPDSAYKYLKFSVSLKDSLYNTDKVQQFKALTFNEAIRHQQLEQQAEETKKELQANLKVYGLAGGIVVFFILAFVQYRNNKQKEKSNVLLRTQKKEIENTLGELKNTQKQLIQSEKMASLGELTAGIAHEIQNPLNFVNNFSDLNAELVDELKSELTVGNLQSANEIADNIKNNEKKINQHGKRADAIVKSMLQHSRKSSGQKELTDINALCDEYLRLAYHGLRAKEKDFNAKMETDFDNSNSKINIVPQEMGRVMLNLINNAFYAANDKQKAQRLKPIAESRLYEPLVMVSTRKNKDKIEIRVKDNGNGIPQSIADKIFQPFFTTKPTGQGTGLGLSLSYDIVRAHGGDIRVETRENEGTTFIIQLPGK